MNLLRLDPEHTMTAWAKTPRPETNSLTLLKRVLYFPWAWLVWIPYLGFSTALFGSVAFVVGFFRPHWSIRIGTAWAWLLCRVPFARIRVEGRKHLDTTRSYVIMSNHQSNFDVLTLYGHWAGQFRWVIKQELRKIPFLGPACAKMGHIFIDRSNRQRAIASLEAARPQLTGGVSVLFFPEGTRSPDGRLRDFKKGGFVMALDLGLPILPVSLSGTHKILPGKSLKLLPGKATITIHEAIDTAAYGHERRDQLMADVRASIQQGLTDWERGE